MCSQKDRPHVFRPHVFQEDRLPLREERSSCSGGASAATAYYVG